MPLAPSEHTWGRGAGQVTGDGLAPVLLMEGKRSSRWEDSWKFLTCCAPEPSNSTSGHLSQGRGQHTHIKPVHRHLRQLCSSGSRGEGTQMNFSRCMDKEAAASRLWSALQWAGTRCP